MAVTDNQFAQLIDLARDCGFHAGREGRSAELSEQLIVQDVLFQSYIEGMCTEDEFASSLTLSDLPDPADAFDLAEAWRNSHAMGRGARAALGPVPSEAGR